MASLNCTRCNGLKRQQCVCLVYNLPPGLASFTSLTISNYRYGRIQSLDNLPYGLPNFNCGDRIKHWKPSVEVHSKFTFATNELFGTLLLGIQRLEETDGLPLADQMMLEEMLECWTKADDIALLSSL